MFKEDIIGIKQKSQLYRVVSYIGWSVLSGTIFITSGCIEYSSTCT